MFIFHSPWPQIRVQKTDAGNKDANKMMKLFTLLKKKRELLINLSTLKGETMS